MSSISPAEFMGTPEPRRRGSAAGGISPETFMAGAPRALQGNTAWASRYARELRGVITRQATLAPRSQQVHLGPSEIGSACDRQIVGKLIREPRTNNVSDPWPSILGSATHAWLAQAFDDDNRRERLLRWITETRVIPHPDYSGSADLYDAAEAALVDHKILGASSLSKIKSVKGPSRKYRVQLLLYARGYQNLGLPVRRVVLAAYPRTAASLDAMYIWDHPLQPEDDELIAEVLDRMETRQLAARMITEGRMRLEEVRITPSDDECFFLHSAPSIVRKAHTIAEQYAREW
jgi:hypothetical protein